MKRREATSSQRAKPAVISLAFPTDGVVAQLGERLNGIQEVSGSIPLSSTKGIQDLRKRRFSGGPCRGRA